MTQSIVPSPWQLAQEAAEATSCKYSDCDGSFHDSDLDPAEWMHTTVHARFGDDVLADIVDEPTASPRFWLDLDMLSGGTRTADELRALADQYTKYPAFLRGLADRLDALNSGEAHA